MGWGHARNWQYCFGEHSNQGRRYAPQLVSVSILDDTNLRRNGLKVGVPFLPSASAGGEISKARDVSRSF
jgi:hypothetical protein